jgi:predicted metal-dependent peptidase
MSQLVPAPGKRSQGLTEAISALLVQEPFFASLLLDLTELKETAILPSGAQLDVAATNGKTIWVNPATFGPLSIKERMGVLAHEVMHIILQHCHRAYMYHSLGVGPDLKPFSAKKFNHATDYIINAYLTKLGFHLPLGSLQNSQVTGDDIADEIYLKLPDEEEDTKDGWDHHEPADANDPENKPAVQSAIKKAQEIAKMAGKGTGGLQRLIDDICEPQIPWHEHLQKAITTTTRGRDAQTWSRPNRRKLAVAPHVYWPGRCGHQGPHIAVEIDTSGSIDDATLKTFMSELSGILTEVQPEMVYVMYVDDDIHGDVIEIDDVNNLMDVARQAGGGGGTDMTKVFSIIEEKQLPAETVIILTDGYTPFGEDTGIPTIWCMTTDIVAPWGVTVHVDVGGAK